MNIIQWLIGKLEKDVEFSAGHIELENLSESDRQQAFEKFSEGDANLKKFLETAYSNGAPSIFCCSGHGEKPAYVTLKVTAENIELYTDTTPSIYYHEEFCTSYKPFGFDFKKKL